MLSLKAIPNVAWAALSIGLPLTLVYKFGEDALPLLLAILGVVTAGFVYFLGYTKYAFTALMATLLFSIELPILGGAALSLPAEPLALLLAVCGALALLQDASHVKKWKNQAIFWALLLLILAWSISTATSTMFQVSVKYVAINIVFMAVGVVVFPLLWQQSDFTPQRILRWLFIPLIFFGFFAIYNLWPHRFNPGAAPEMAQPFFKEHTVFSAAIPLFVPLLLL